MQHNITLTRGLRALLASGVAAVLAAPIAAQTIDDSPATGTIEMWIGGVDDAESIVAGFKEANPDVDIVVTAIPEDNLDSKVLSAVASGVVPDLIRLPFVTLKSDLSTGGFAPVPDGLIDYANFPEGAVEAGAIDGTVYSVPWSVYTPALIYRKDMAEAAGVEAPKTWDELKTFAAALQAQGAEFPIGLGVGYDAYTAADVYDYVQQAGGSLLNEDQSAWTLNSPEAVTALDFMYGDLIKEGFASPDGPQFLDTTPWFTSGKVGSVVNGVWFRSWLEEANGKEWVDANVAAAPFPAGPGGVGSMTMAGNGLVVPTGAKNPDAAWKLARYLTEVGPQVKTYEAAGLLPASNEAWKEPIFASDPYLVAFSEALTTATPPISVPTWGEVAMVIGRATENVATGAMSAQEALDDAQKRAQRIGVGAE